MTRHVNASTWPASDVALIPLTSHPTSQDPRLARPSRPQTSLSQLRYNQSHHDFKTLRRLASTLSAPHAHSMRPMVPSNFLLISNLNDNITTEFLTRAITRIGHVRNVYIPSIARRRQGVARVQLPTAADPQLYVSKLHDTPLCGMRITVSVDRYAKQFHATWKNILKSTSKAASDSNPTSKSKSQSSAPVPSEQKPASSSERKRSFPEASSSSGLGSPVSRKARKTGTPSKSRFSSIVPSQSQTPLSSQSNCTGNGPHGALSHPPRPSSSSQGTDEDCPSHAKSPAGSQLKRSRSRWDQPPQHLRSARANVSPPLSRLQQCRNMCHTGQHRLQPALLVTDVGGDLHASRLMVGFAAFSPDSAVFLDDSNWIVTFKTGINRDSAFSSASAGFSYTRRVEYRARKDDDGCLHASENNEESPNIDLESSRRGRAGQAPLLAGNVDSYKGKDGRDSRASIIPADTVSSGYRKHVIDAPTIGDVCLTTPPPQNVEAQPQKAVRSEQEFVAVRCGRDESVQDPRSVDVQGVEGCELVSDEAVYKRLRDMVIEQITAHVVARREHQLQSVVNQKVLQFVKREKTERKDKQDVRHRQDHAASVKDRGTEDWPFSSTHCSLDEYLRSEDARPKVKPRAKATSTGVKRAECVGDKLRENSDDYKQLLETDRRAVPLSCMTRSQFTELANQLAEDEVQSDVLDKEAMPLRYNGQRKRKRPKSRFDGSSVVSSAKEESFLSKQVKPCIEQTEKTSVPSTPSVKAQLSTDSDSGGSFGYKDGSREHKDGTDASFDSSESSADLKGATLRSTGKRNRGCDDSSLRNADNSLKGSAPHVPKRKKSEPRSYDEVAPGSAIGLTTSVTPTEATGTGKRQNSATIAGGEDMSKEDKTEETEAESARTAGYFRKDWQTKTCRAQSHHHPENKWVAYSSRENRQQYRLFRKQLSMINPKHDLFTANSLKQRKKPVQYRKSMIHGMGLFSMGPIEAGEFIIEYIGELIRGSVASTRQEKYTRRGMGDSYLFRLSNGMVVDATHRGCIARFINHSCDPNIIAKIISVDSQDKIVFYSKKHIKEGEELTYDYKFDYEADDLKIPCLCGAWNCRKFLN